MENLYFSIFNGEAFNIKPDKYDYNDLEMWMPKFATLFLNKNVGKDRLLQILDHFLLSVNFGQMSKSVVVTFFVSLGSFFTRENLTNDEKLKLVNFISKIMQNQDLDLIGAEFGSMSSLENLTYWVCQHFMEPKYSVTFPAFLACYSQLGSTAISFLQKNIKDPESRRYILRAFTEENPDKKTAQIQMDLLLLMWNLSLVSSPEQTAQVAEKFFKRDDHLDQVWKRCKNELNTNPGGANGLISASILAQKFSEKLPDEVFRFEDENKNRGNMISVCIKALRDADQDFDSTGKATIAKLLFKISKLNKKISEMVVNALSEDEDDHGDSLILNLIAKDPLKHGSLPNWSAELFISLELGDIGNYPQRADLQNVLTEQLYQVKESLSLVDHINITLAHRKLMILTKMTKEVTCPRNTSTQCASGLTDCILEILEDLAQQKPRSEILTWSFCKLYEWLPTTEVGKLNESRTFMNMLRNSIGTLLKSEVLEMRQYAFRVARGISEDIIPTSDFFTQLPVPTSGSKRVYVDEDEDKENTPVNANMKIKKENFRVFTKELSETRRLLRQREDEIGHIQNLYKKEKELRSSLEEKVVFDNSNKTFDSMTVLSLTSEINIWKHKVEDLEGSAKEMNVKISQHKQELKEGKLRCEKYIQEVNNVQKSKEAVISDLNKLKSELKREKQARKAAEEENEATMGVIGKLFNKKGGKGHNSSN